MIIGDGLFPGLSLFNVAPPVLVRIVEPAPAPRNVTPRSSCTKLPSAIVKVPAERDTTCPSGQASTAFWMLAVSSVPLPSGLTVAHTVVRFGIPPADSMPALCQFADALRSADSTVVPPPEELPPEELLLEDIPLEEPPLLEVLLPDELLVPEELLEEVPLEEPPLLEVLLPDELLVPEELLEEVPPEELPLDELPPEELPPEAPTLRLNAGREALSTPSVR